MRTFLALRPDHASRERLATIATRLREWGLPGRWVHPEDLHCTLAFLGEVDAVETAVLPAVLDEVAGSCTVPELELPGIGAFAGKHEPRVVYAALHDPEERCRQYHEAICEVLALTPERAFHPHITLCRPGRGRRQPDRDWPQLLQAFGQALWGPCLMADIALLESTGGGDGPRYRELASWPLINRRAAG